MSGRAYAPFDRIELPFLRNDLAHEARPHYTALSKVKSKNSLATPRRITFVNHNVILFSFERMCYRAAHIEETEAFIGEKIHGNNIKNARHYQPWG